MPDPPMRIETSLWYPIYREAKFHIVGVWSAEVGFGWGSWAVGFGFDDHPWDFGVNIGPLDMGVGEDKSVADYDYNELWNWSRTLLRLTIQRFKLEIRLEFDLNIWLIGYRMADSHDHGLYLGPFNIQIEYDKFYDWPDMHTPPPRLRCRCAELERQGVAKYGQN